MDKGKAGSQKSCVGCLADTDWLTAWGAWRAQIGSQPGARGRLQVVRRLQDAGTVPRFCRAGTHQLLASLCGDQEAEETACDSTEWQGAEGG